MSDQAPLPGTDDKQVINDIPDIDADIDVMHDRYRELWVDIELADISIPQHLQSSFNRTYQQIDSLTKPLQIARLSKMVQQLEMILSKKKTGRKNSESASMDLESQTGASAEQIPVRQASVQPLKLPFRIEAKISHGRPSKTLCLEYACQWTTGVSDDLCLQYSRRNCRPSSRLP